MFVAIVAVRLAVAVVGALGFLLGLVGLVFGYYFRPGRPPRRGKEARIACAKVMGVCLVVVWAVSLLGDVLLRVLYGPIRP